MCVLFTATSFIVLFAGGASVEALASATQSSLRRRSQEPEQRRRESLSVGRNPLLSLNLNLDALARADAPERAQELYQRIASLHREGYYETPPDTVSFNTVLKAYRNDPSKALDFWEAEAGLLGKRVNVRSYNTFLLALAKAGIYDAAESLLQQMQYVAAACRPDIVTFNTVLLAFATATLIRDDKEAVVKAENLLERMISGEQVNTVDDGDQLGIPSVHDKNYLVPKPDTLSFNTVISAWAAYPDTLHGARRAEHWLQVMKRYGSVQPDVYSYSIVMKAWSRCSNNHDLAVNRTQCLLDDMDSSDHVQPNEIVYTTAMRLFCQSLRPDKAMMVLSNMIQKNMQPDVVSFSTLIDGWAKYAEARASKENSVGKNAVQAAFRLLQQMKDTAYPERAPTQQTYTSLLKVLAHANIPEQGSIAKHVLKEMRATLHPISKIRSTPPSTIHYNAAIDCIANMPSATRGIDAGSLWKEMKEAGVDCDTASYNCVIKAAANSYGNHHIKQKSLQVGMEAFRCLQADESCEPTSLTYNYYFKLLRRLLSQSIPNRMDFVQTAFELCCRQGCLNDIVLKQMLVGLSEDDAKRLLSNCGINQSDGPIELSDLPNEWSQNAL
jgi:pentatricopeptide repeat protein